MSNETPSELVTERFAQIDVKPVSNAVDTNYIVTVKIKKDHPPGITPFNGVHSRLREIGKAIIATR